MWKDILNPRVDHSETVEAIVRILRGKPGSASEAKRFYSLGESQQIEDKLDEANITKMKLPVTSKKAVEEVKKDDLIEVDRINIVDLVDDLEKLETKENNW